METKDDPHHARRREILHSHPEVARLIGRERRTAMFIVVLVGLQYSAAAFLAMTNRSVVVCALAAYLMGAFLDHALWALIHDATHNLVFKSTASNRAVLTLANLPHVVPSAAIFRYYHLQHHGNLNQLDTDPDIPAEWEARMVGNSCIMKCIWLSNFFVFSSIRLLSQSSPGPRELGWIALNWVCNLSFNAYATHLFGLKFFGYLLFSSTCAIGLHPLGARWIQEHYPTQPFQASYSYYGTINLVAFNIGYHNEHHDFPNIPWSRLPTLHKLSPEHYSSLFSHESYSRLLLEFVFDPRWSLVVRRSTKS